MVSPRSSVFVLFLLFAWRPSIADVVTLTPHKDNTLYESLAGSYSNGNGTGMFAGRTAGHFPDPPFLRRALVAFDVSSVIPSNAMIDSVSLTLHMTRTADPTLRTIALHRVLSDWGEGGSNAGETGDGNGAQARVGDATWIHTFFNIGFWSTLGGVFEPSPSATAGVGDAGRYTWGSTPSLIADVRAWMDSPATNFGWLLKGDETNEATAKRFSTRESDTIAQRPQLTIYFTPDLVPVEPTTWGAIKALYR